jgi:hypothetical protein
MTAGVATPRPAPAPAASAPPTAPPPGRPAVAAPAQGRPAAADLRFRRLQAGMFVAGAVLMPVGIVVICLGWYGSAHSHYAYDQNVYLVSGGILGLSLTFLGGFLYFGAWLARLSADQRDAARQLADAVRALSAGPARTPAWSPAAAPAPASQSAEYGDYVLAGNGTTVHRRDCPLIAARNDLRPYVDEQSATSTCRVCRPGD